jgi:hypothetical protein
VNIHQLIHGAISLLELSVGFHVGKVRGQQPGGSRLTILVVEAVPAAECWRREASVNTR